MPAVGGFWAADFWDDDFWAADFWGSGDVVSVATIEAGMLTLVPDGGARQTRKTGDALILSGELTGDVPADADWVGATAEIHIVTKATRAVPSEEERTEDCAITAPSGDTPGRYHYVGGPIEEGKYVYEIQVTFVGLNDPLTWPNQGSKFSLKVVPELG